VGWCARRAWLGGQQPIAENDKSDGDRQFDEIWADYADCSLRRRLLPALAGETPAPRGLLAVVAKRPPDFLAAPLRARCLGGRRREHLGR